MKSNSNVNLKSSFRVIEVHPTKVKIQDLNTGKSVTNDAEAVCMFLHKHYGNRQYLYIDTMGEESELLHTDGIFTGFKTI